MILRGQYLNAQIEEKAALVFQFIGERIVCILQFQIKNYEKIKTPYVFFLNEKPRTFFSRCVKNDDFSSFHFFRK